MPRVIHASSAELTDCPYREEQYRSGQWQSQPQPYFIRGRAVHAAREYALGVYLQHRELPSAEEVESKAIGDTEAAEREIDDREPWRREATPEELTEGLDEALPLIRADYHLGLPQIAPHVEAVESLGQVEIEGGEFVLTGSCDIRGRDPTTRTATILDLKTAKANPGMMAQVKADMSQQLSIYALMYRALFGEIPMHCLDYLWPGKRKPKAVDGVEVYEFAEKQPGDVKYAMRRVVTTSRSAADLDAAARRLRVKIDAIRQGWHPPAPISGITSPCSGCWHRANPDAAQRCEYTPDVRR